MDAPASVASNGTVEACERCPLLCESRTQIVNGRGERGAAILFVGEAPGYEEDKTGKPFQGRSGQVLARMIEDAGVEFSDIYLTNTVRCRPQGNRAPTNREMENCREFLLDEIRYVQPKVIVAVGAKALHDLYPGGMLRDMLGQVLTQPDTGLPLITIYHPSYIMRGNWGLTGMMTEYIIRAAKLAQGKLAKEPLADTQARQVVVSSLDELRQVKDLLAGQVSVLVVDTESFPVAEEYTGLDWVGAELLCIGFSGLTTKHKPLGYGITVPLLQQGGVPYWSPAEWAEVKAILAEMVASHPIAMHNALHDVRMLNRSEAPEGAVDSRITTILEPMPLGQLAYDTMIMQRLLAFDIPANETALTNLYTSIPYYEDAINEASQHKRRMDLAPNDKVWTYQAIDVDAGARILAALLRKMETHPELRWVHDNIAIPMIRNCWKMIARGVAIDLPYIYALCSDYADRIRALEDEIQALSPAPVNLRSPRQLQKLLFQDIGLPRSGKKTLGSKGCPDCAGATNEVCLIHDALDKEVLEELHEKTHHPIVKLLLDWKALTKHRSTYLDGSNGDGGLVALIRDDGRVHAEQRVNAAITGRLSVSRPPLHQIPKNVDSPKLGHNILRRTMIASPGRKLGEYDWSQGELWVMAYVSGDENLLALLKAGRDIHTYVARALCALNISSKFPKQSLRPDLTDEEWRMEFDELRRATKPFVFGMDYGMTPIGIQQRLHCTLDEAAAMANAYTSEIFPGLGAWNRHVETELFATGYLQNRFGRRFEPPNLPLVKQLDSLSAGEIIRTGGNMPSQSGLSDLQQITHNRLENMMGDRLSIVLSVHDSCLFEFDEAPMEDTVELMWDIKRLCEATAKDAILYDGSTLGWDIPVEVSWGDSWGSLDWKITTNGTLVAPKEDA